MLKFYVGDQKSFVPIIQNVKWFLDPTNTPSDFGNVLLNLK